MHCDCFWFLLLGIWWMTKILVPTMFDWLNNLRCVEFVLLSPLFQTLTTISIDCSVAHNTLTVLDIPLCNKQNNLKWVWVQTKIPTFTYFRSAPMKFRSINSLIRIIFKCSWFAIWVSPTEESMLKIQKSNNYQIEFGKY